MYILHKGIKQFNEYLPRTNHWLVLAASIPVALSAGTLFVYSVYGTQLAEKCQLDASKTANLNISATVGTAVGGVVSGLVTDAYGTQMPILFSCLALSLGYKWLYSLYQGGSASSSIALLSAMFLIGFGSVSGYFSSIKAVTVNFPNFKGSAQSITIASFAISSLVYSYISTTIYQRDVGGFLFFLHISCGLMVLIGFIFIRVDGHLHQEESSGLLVEVEANNNDSEYDGSNYYKNLKNLNIKDSVTHPIFWYHYFILAIVQGLGQMYIYSVGFILKAVHYYYSQLSSSNDLPPVNHLQALHVSLIAIASFIGRLSSGPQSDFLVKELKCQRHWILILGLSIMGLGHLLNILSIDHYFDNLHSANFFLSVVSLLIGYAYGFCFTCYPAIISDLFHMRNYSFIWGVMYTSTSFGLTLMTKVFGYVYDLNSEEWNGGEYICAKGSGCYNFTFEITFGLCVFVILLILGYIYEKRSVNQNYEELAD